jgi:glycerol kinase
MPYVLAIDQGTSSSRSIVFDECGKKLGSSQREFTQHFPEPGWVEHDAEEIWLTVVTTMREALREAGVAAADLAAIGITNQRETVLLWERASGHPLAKAIVWQDRRTAPRIERLRAERHEKRIQQRTGLLLDPYFSASKIEWLLDHVPKGRERARRGEIAAGTIDSWLVYRLTGGTTHITDVSNASRTMLMNLKTGAWDASLCELFGVPAPLLPKIGPTSGRLAETERGLLGASVPVCSIVGDQQSALFGQLCTKPGLAKNTYGTGCFMLLHTGKKPIASKNRLLTTVAWQRGNAPIEYALEGSVFMAGATIQWLRDGLQIIRSAPEVNDLAASVPDAGGVTLVPAFTGLGAPYWDASARGTIVGLTRGSTKAHIARATLDAIALQVADVLDAMQADSGGKLRELRVDGGAAASDLLMQLQSDLLGVKVVRPANLETTALGAFFLAGLAAKVWPSVDALASQVEVERTFVPAMAKAERTGRIAEWRRAVERARGWDVAAGSLPKRLVPAKREAQSVAVRAVRDAKARTAAKKAVRPRPR